MTLPPRRGPRCCGPCCAAAGRADARRRGRGRAQVRGGELRDTDTRTSARIARILCGDLDGGEVSLEDAVSVGEQIGSPEHVAVGLCERSLVAMARSQWDQAEVLAGQARSVMRKAGIEESYATPLVSAVRARTAMHRADLPQYIRSSPALSAYGIC